MRLFHSVVLVGLLSLGSVCAAHWGYEEDNGPSTWGQDYPECNGMEQSPINIISKDTASVANALAIEYKADSQNIINNGHSVQVNFAKNNTITYGGQEYALVQLHFHTPSENTIDGKSYPLEMHLVHSSLDGKLLVIGVLFTEGEANTELQKIVEAAPEQSGVVRDFEGLNPANILPNKLSYYAFSGSLTTPPCSQNVQWVVLGQTISASKSQIDSLHTIMHTNARNTQPLNGREIQSAQ